MNKFITKQDILDKDPCHCIEKYNITEPISLLSILGREDVRSRDKIWVVSRFLDDKTNRLFAVWCARQVLTEDSDPRSIEACNVAEKYALGEATKEELEVAKGAAYAAAAAAAAAAADAARAANTDAARAANTERGQIAANTERGQIAQLIKMIKNN